MENGKFVAGGSAKASAGPGGSLGLGLEVDVDGLKTSWNDFADKLGEGLVNSDHPTMTPTT